MKQAYTVTYTKLKDKFNFIFVILVVANTVQEVIDKLTKEIKEDINITEIKVYVFKVII